MATRTITLPVRLTVEEDRIVRQLAAQRSASINSVVRWSVLTVARQELDRLAKAGKKSDRTAVSDAHAVAL
jgi:formiminotetrahydrofolate cyclodeaminase